ncbi:MAG: hypothetical protein ACLQE9_20635 [Roseiarcus sp.]
MSELSERLDEAALFGPCERQAGEIGDTDAARQSPLDRAAHHGWGDKGQRQGRSDGPLAFALAPREGAAVLDIAFHHLADSTSPKRHFGEKSIAGLCGLGARVAIAAWPRRDDLAPGMARHRGPGNADDA